MRFGHLKVIERDRSLPSRNVRWICACDCGKISSVPSGNLLSGNSKSCGCGKIHRGKTNGSYRHGGAHTDLYNVWKSMRQRCMNNMSHDYRWYGGNGISICDEWQDYNVFKEWSESSGYRKGLTIDRIDRTGNYSPDNCRWITIQEQQQNKRNVRKYEYNGDSKSITEWSTLFGLDRRFVANRLDHGWTIEEALTIPKGRKRAN